jgi:putative glutamine amidotransferase
MPGEGRKGRSLSSQLPRIAIPEPTSTDAAYNQRSLPQYIHAVEAAGGVAVPISLHESKTTQASVLASCSAILLPGSPADIDPGRYGQQAVKECAAKDTPREDADDLLLHDAFDQGKPILGICYGLQSLNVYRQGSLIQDLPHPGAPVSDEATSDETTVVDHQPGREVRNAHPVLVTPASRLFRAISGAAEGAGEQLELSVNSSHHQAVGLPGELLMIAATSPADGVIEALEGADPQQFVVAVQWHPERSYESSAASRALFTAFVEAARFWASQPGPGKA